MAKKQKPAGAVDFQPGNKLQALRAHCGPPPMAVYRAVQDALDSPTLIEGETKAIIARTFEAISAGVNRRDASGQPDSTTLGFCNLVKELYFGKNGDPGSEMDRGTFRIKVVYDDERPNLGLVDPDPPKR
ncbi:MAG: hypothetical protein EBR82_26445 [Caulobacteraceae bacterium]|nr:hypothetical protein [Caulobacteraceae bacterium]